MYNKSSHGSRRVFIVSVIVPIYNVKPYLSQCIDSILNQTCNNFELLLIDDGSTDRSGSIADSYTDPRIHVFHTENHGLSAARNFGIIHASGKFILFVDADDWIEPDLIETALDHIGSSDVLCFSHNNVRYHFDVFSSTEALYALAAGKLSRTAWSMLYKRDCFSSIRFPEGRIYEDIATTYKVFLKAKIIKSIDYCGYHYRYRTNSLSHSNSLKRLIDLQLAYKEMYKACEGFVDNQTSSHLLKNYAEHTAYAWAWKNSFTKDIPSEYVEMSQSAKQDFKSSHQFPPHIQVGIFFAKHPSKLSFWLANKILIITRRLQNKHE